MSANDFKINEEKNDIHDNILEIMGAEFRFDHAKGLSEWLKNSVDAYRRNGVADKDQYVYFRFADGKNNSATIESVDFNGMSESDIVGAFKRWGDPEAAKRGNKSLKTFGGHGNGGKFYMRQMFNTSYFITYKEGLLNMFGFNESKKYGFVDNYKSKAMSPDEAIAFAGLDKLYIPKIAIENIRSNKNGFTVVRGTGPANMPNMLKVNFVINNLVSHPQSQRILSRIPSKVIYNDKIFMEKLEIEELAPLTGFEYLEPIEVPSVLTYEAHNERQEIVLADNKYPNGTLKLFTSEIPLTRGSKYGEWNRIDVLGELGVIGSYKLHEIGGMSFPQAVFIYGELEVPILEKPGVDSVQNDRAKLIDNPMTATLLEWVNVQIIDLCKKIGDKERQERDEKMKDISSSLNNFLNQWKDKFMSKILSQVLSGTGPNAGRGAGGTGGGGTDGGGGDGRPVETPGGSGIVDGGGNGTGEGGDGGEGEKGGGDDTPRPSKRSPRVLLSDQDPDPFGENGESITLSPRQPAVYQSLRDVDEGIYWINTSAPLAKSILDRYDQNDPRWRDYLFQRYVDIFVREALSVMEKNDPDEFNAANVERRINDVVTSIHQAAATELSSFLFEDTFTVD